MNLFILEAVLIIPLPDEILEDKNVNLSDLQSLANLELWVFGLCLVSHLEIRTQFVQPWGHLVIWIIV